MRQNYKLIVEYDGTHFHGWQKQRSERTVQGVLEAAIHTMTGESGRVTGSGRTDAGVHARAQTANFHSASGIPPAAFLRGLNSLLPDDVVIHRCEAVAADFHARYDARCKHYRYRILNRDLPAAVGRQYAWHVRRPLSLADMRAAAAVLVGTHDFKTFEGAGSPRASTVRRVLRAEFETRRHGYLYFEIEANGFLRYMVRNIVGTLVDVGLQKTDPAGMTTILNARNRRCAGATAPGHGLFLMSVAYGSSV